MIKICSWMRRSKKPVHFVEILRPWYGGPGRGATRGTQQHDGITATGKVIVVSSAVVQPHQSQVRKPTDSGVEWAV